MKKLRENKSIKIFKTSLSENTKREQYLEDNNTELRKRRE